MFAFDWRRVVMNIIRIGRGVGTGCALSWLLQPVFFFSFHATRIHLELLQLLRQSASLAERRNWTGGYTGISSGISSKYRVHGPLIHQREQHDLKRENQSKQGQKTPKELWETQKKTRTKEQCSVGVDAATIEGAEENLDGGLRRCVVLAARCFQVPETSTAVIWSICLKVDICCSLDTGRVWRGFLFVFLFVVLKTTYGGIFQSILYYVPDIISI
jgi:hypothetical protein